MKVGKKMAQPERNQLTDHEGMMSEILSRRLGKPVIYRMAVTLYKIGPDGKRHMVLDNFTSRTTK